MTPARFQPGIGLRPGGERPDLEEFVRVAYAALYESVAATVGLGLNVVVDVGHHDEHSRPLGTLADAARRLDGFEAWLVGVRCKIEVIMERRAASSESIYVRGTADEPVPAHVAAWQRAVHIPGIYDLEVDTSVLSPAACAEEIRQRMKQAPVALRTLATRARESGDGGD
jgi:chloramphenicol 3-O phosphotransferase